MKRFLFGLLICMSWSTPTFACAVGGKDWAGAVNGVVEVFRNGKYHEIEEIVRDTITFGKDGEFQKLVSDLEEYQPDGFGKCRIYMRENLPPLVEKILFQFAGSDGNGVFVYVFVVDGGPEFKSGIQILRISTDIEDILNIWSKS